MRLLVIGGTAFLGRHLVEAALERGHQVTLFNRGRTGPELFPEAEHLVGDRNTNLSALGGREWDACFDPSAYFPRQVRAAAALLGPAIGHYTLISSASVYALDGPKSEDSPTLELSRPDSEDLQEYGALKAACEREAAAAYGSGRVLVSRSGLIVGPWDPTHRFTYWPVRVARGGEVLAPGRPEAPVQLIHARDEAEWLLDGAERGLHGTFNCTGPAEPATFGRLLDSCRAVARSDAALTWVPDGFLLEQQVEPWVELPLWLPPSAGSLHDVQVERALAEGLRFRPLEQTVAETLAWARAHPDFASPTDSTGRARERAGIDPEKERRVLAAWHRAPG